VTCTAPLCIAGFGCSSTGPSCHSCM
jgi:hypothetical protein